MNYGFPYMGSKSSKMEEIGYLFPPMDNFYDLFGGGFSVTHWMLTHRASRFNNFHFNEVNPLNVELVKKAVNGEFSYDKFKPDFISRDDFFDKKETCGFVKYIWSFGNNGTDYLYSRRIEPYKKSMSEAVVFNKFDDLSREVLGISRFPEEMTIKDRRIFLRRGIERCRKEGIPDVLKGFLSKKQLLQLERLQQLEQLERLQQLQQLERLQKLELSSLCYSKIKIKKNSVVYCDIPYSKTSEYDKNINFNRAVFLDWAHSQEEPVYISEYNINDNRFHLIKEFKTRSTFRGNRESTEKVYCNDPGLRAFRSKRS